MFASDLRQARADIKLTVQLFAELTGISTSLVAAYESGAEMPRVDEAERIFAALGQAYVPLEGPLKWRGRLDADVLSPLTGWVPDRGLLVEKARRDQAVIVDADANAERLGLTWGQVKTVVDGAPVAGDELSIWRVQELASSASKRLRGIQRGVEPQLRVITPKGLVTADLDLPIPERALTFLVTATAHGANPAFTRHLAGGFLAHHGYPWLWVPHELGAEYRRALVACRRDAGGDLMAGVLIQSIEELDERQPGYGR